MQDFRATKVISSIKSKNSYKECDHCKVVEILKHQSCLELCLADSQKEQKLVSEKIKKSLSKPITTLLSQIFNTPHNDINARLSTLEQNIAGLTSSFSSIPLPISPKSEKISENDPKLKMLEEKLNRIEDLLNTRAAEIYDLKEQVSLLDPPKNENLPISDLQVFKEELKKQKKILDEKKFLNDGTRLDLLKMKKERPLKVQRNKKDVENELNAIKEKNKYVEKMVERLEILQKGICDRTRLTVSSLENLQDSVNGVKEEQRMLSVLEPQDLVKITKNVFSSYRTLKEMQERTVTKVNSTLEKLKNLPSLVPKIVEIQEEIEKNCFKN